MDHPILDAFDCMIDAFGFLDTPSMRHAVLLFSPHSKPALFGRDWGTDDGQAVPFVHTGPAHGHKRLKLHTQVAGVVEAAHAFQRSMHTVPRLQALFANSALNATYGFFKEYALNGLHFAWRPMCSLDGIQAEFGADWAHFSARTMRSCLAEAIALSATPPANGLVPCTVFDRNFDQENFRLLADPAVLGALQPLFLPDTRVSHVGAHQRTITVSDQPMVDGTDHHPGAEKVQAAYQALFALVSPLRGNFREILLEDAEGSCYFWTNGGSTIRAGGAPRALASHLDEPPQDPPTIDPDSLDTCVAAILDAWRRFVAAFPVGCHWEHARPSLQAFHPSSKLPPATLLVQLGSRARRVVFETSAVPAWLTPKAGKAFFAQTHDEGAIFTVHAGTDAAAAALACRLCPPPQGFPAQVRLWDKWQASHKTSTPGG